jgi:hypothetical protein
MQPGSRGILMQAKSWKGITRMSNIDQSNIDLLDATTLPPSDSWNPETMMPARLSGDGARSWRMPR